MLLCLDGWHKAKKISENWPTAEINKLDVVSKDCLSDKQKAVKNHFYFCLNNIDQKVSAYTAAGNLLTEAKVLEFGEELYHAFLSCVEHWCGWHQKCPNKEHCESRSKQHKLIESLTAANVLAEYLKNNFTLAEARYYIRNRQTSFIESFNRMLLRFAPKHLTFNDSYAWRITLAMLEWNENILTRTREAKEKGGDRKFVRQNKTSHGQVRIIFSKKTINYRYYIYNMLLFQRIDLDVSSVWKEKFGESPFERGSRIQFEERRMVQPQTQKLQEQKGCGCLGSAKTLPCSTGHCGCRKMIANCHTELCKCKGMCANKPNVVPSQEQIMEFAIKIHKKPIMEAVVEKNNAENGNGNEHENENENEKENGKDKGKVKAKSKANGGGKANQKNSRSVFNKS